NVLLKMINDIQSGREPIVDTTYVAAIGGVLDRADEDHAFTALMLMPPSESELALCLTPIDPEAIHRARKCLISAVAAAHGTALTSLFRRLESKGAFSPDAA